MNGCTGSISYHRSYVTSTRSTNYWHIALGFCARSTFRYGKDNTFNINLVYKRILDVLQSLTRGRNSWSLSEVMHAIVLLTHFHALSSFVFSCGLTQKLDGLRRVRAQQRRGSVTGAPTANVDASAETTEMIGVEQPINMLPTVNELDVPDMLTANIFSSNSSHICNNLSVTEKTVLHEIILNKQNNSQSLNNNASRSTSTNNTGSSNDSALLHANDGNNATELAKESVSSEVVTTPSYRIYGLIEKDKIVKGNPIELVEPQGANQLTIC